MRLRVLIFGMIRVKEVRPLLVAASPVWRAPLAEDRATACLHPT